MIDNFSLFISVGYIVVFGGIAVALVVLVRLMLVATTALRSITRERDVRLDLLLAADEDDVTA